MSDLSSLGQYIGLLGNTEFFNASQAVGFANFATFKRYTSKGFTKEKFGNFFGNEAVFNKMDSYFTQYGFVTNSPAFVQLYKDLQSFPIEIEIIVWWLKKTPQQRQLVIDGFASHS